MFNSAVDHRHYIIIIYSRTVTNSLRAIRRADRGRGRRFVRLVGWLAVNDASLNDGVGVRRLTDAIKKLRIITEQKKLTTIFRYS